MNENNDYEVGITSGDTSSSDPTITRKQFIGKVMKGAVITGGIFVAPKVLDKFILPAQAAKTSSCTISDTKGGNDQATHNGKATDVISFPVADTLCNSAGQ